MCSIESLSKWLITSLAEHLPIIVALIVADRPHVGPKHIIGALRFVIIFIWLQVPQNGQVLASPEFKGMPIGYESQEKAPVDIVSLVLFLKVLHF
jgi:hypothetical protein